MRFSKISLPTLFAALFAAALIGSFAAAEVPAQRSKTIILVRHAEKDMSEAADQNDPPLSAEGTERARRLLKIVKRYRPGEVFSTDYSRTRMTVAPIAERRNVPVQPYDPKQPQALLDKIMASKTKRFVIAGHSNTIARLANLIGGKELFKDLDESEYGTIWLIRLRHGHLKKIEIIPY